MVGADDEHLFHLHGPVIEGWQFHILQHFREDGHYQLHQERRQRLEEILVEAQRIAYRIHHYFRRVEFNAQGVGVVVVRDGGGEDDPESGV